MLVFLCELGVCSAIEMSLVIYFLFVKNSHHAHKQTTSVHVIPGDNNANLR
jgi:hypothetical protein